jgi:hypothetical protein
MVYKWRQGSQFKISAQVVGERIDAIRSSLGRGLKATDVVQDAAGPRSPLHNIFNWNDRTAAHQHRLAVARNLLGALVTVYVDVNKSSEAKQVRSFVSLRDHGTKRDRTFFPLVEVMNDKAKREQLLKLAYGEYKAYHQRYRQLDELSELFQAGNVVFGRLPRKFRKAA